MLLKGLCFVFMTIVPEVHGVAMWEHIIQVVGSDPFNKVVMAKQIGEEYGMH